MSNTKDRHSARERLKQAGWAGLVALVLSVLFVLDPLDQFLWVTQSRMAPQPASGDIVYVGSNEDLTDPHFPERRVELARKLDALREAGVSRIYLDMVFDEPSTQAADAALNEALAAYAGEALLIDNITTDLNGEDRLDSTIDAIGKDVPQVASDRWQNFLGYTWAMPYRVQFRDREFASAPASIAGVEINSDAQFPINYSFDLGSIPSYRTTDLGPVRSQGDGRASALSELSGKVVVLGILNRADANAPNIPGHIEVPGSMVYIYAAETLKAGYVEIISGPYLLLVFLLLLALIGQSQIRLLRYCGYVALSLAVPATLGATAYLGVKVYASGVLAMLAIYALLRARSYWKTSFRLVDADTNLPSFVALESDKDVAETVPAIIVAKIHRFEEVRRTLPQGLHAEYLIRIIDRLKAAKSDAKIYVGPGHLIAWTFAEKEPALIKEHLEGLRALFSSPLLVGDNQVDVGITFGVDITPSPNVVRRLAGAVSAAEHTTETYEPIKIAEMASDEDLIWNISLQARIDAALANGEIYLIYQPKVLLKTGELVGVESLVRWRDPVKGLIPPDHFIKQCENVGRMSQLTRFVLREACRAGNAFEDRGLKLPIAVNISATLVHERNIIDMVREVLAETGFDPHLLTLEITETYRISNFDRAHAILQELTSLGPKISMDDFGVGAASLEALQRLPFSELKIDRTFIQAMKDNPKASGIVRNVLRMGKDLRIIVVAEGVEDESTLTLLRDSGCQVAQGFGISHPVPFDEILKFHKVGPTQQLRKMV